MLNLKNSLDMYQQHVGSLQIVLLSPSLNKNGICVSMLVMNELCHWPFLACEDTTWSRIWRYLYSFLSKSNVVQL